MQRTTLRSVGLNLRDGFLNGWNKVRALKFRQVMGVIVIVKTFNPLLLLLALALFGFLFVRDIREQYQPALDTISTNYELLVNQDLKGIQDALDDARGALKSLGDILGVVKSVVNGIVGFVNTIINAIAWFFGMSKIDFNIQLPIPDFSTIFRPFNDLSLHFKGLFDGIGELIAATGTVLANLWARFKLFVAVALIWALLSIFASAYSEITRGLDMIRGGSPPERSPDRPSPKVLKEGRHPLQISDTPPILIVDRLRITIPVLAAQDAGPDRRSFRYQERYLLSAQAVWPNRQSPLFHYQLAEKTDEGVWMKFFQSLIERGLDADQVQMVISAETSALQPGAQRFLPHAEVRQSVETTIITA